MPKIDYVVRETSSQPGPQLHHHPGLDPDGGGVAVPGGGVAHAAPGRAERHPALAGRHRVRVFLNSDATQQQIDAVRQDLADSPEVERTTYVDQQASYEEFKQLFADQPELVSSVKPEDLPPSFRVVPVDKQAQVVEELGNQFKGKPGVKSIAFASATIRAVQQLTSRLSFGIVVVAGILLLAAGLLILNTIRMAMFARRREIEVMKLVGATNWFIRVPFMLEGLVQGVVGAAVAIGALALFKPFFERLVAQLAGLPAGQRVRAEQHRAGRHLRAAGPHRLRGRGHRRRHRRHPVPRHLTPRERAWPG